MFLTKHKNGIYYLYYNNQEGNRRKVSTKCRNKSEAMQFLLRFKRDNIKGSESQLTDISLSHFKIKFLAYSEAINSWNHTLSLKTTLNELEKYLNNDILLSSLTRDVVLNFIEHRQKKVSPHTVRKDIADLSSAFKWALTKNYMRENLARGIKKPRIPWKADKPAFHIP